jgi:hypothetical protein
MTQKQFEDYLWEVANKLRVMFGAADFIVNRKYSSKNLINCVKMPGQQPNKVRVFRIVHNWLQRHHSETAIRYCVYCLSCK